MKREIKKYIIVIRWHDMPYTEYETDNLVDAKELFEILKGVLTQDTNPAPPIGLFEKVESQSEQDTTKVQDASHYVEDIINKATTAVNGLCDRDYSYNSKESMYLAGDRHIVSQVKYLAQLARTLAVKIKSQDNEKEH